MAYQIKYTTSAKGKDERDIYISKNDLKHLKYLMKGRAVKGVVVYLEKV